MRRMGLARKQPEAGEGLRRPYREDLDPTILDFYRQCMATLSQSGVEFVVGGTCALTHFAGMTRYTHDLDIFVRGRDVRRALRVLSRQGYHTHLTFPHWLGKAMCGEGYVDLIFSSGNGVVVVDDAWFEHAAQGEVLGVPVLLCPAEEMIWSKSFIMERERFDGGDVAHILRAHAGNLDWRRLVDRFGAHWRVLYSHLVLFGFIYPDARDTIPAEVMRELCQRTLREVEEPAPQGKVCQGTLLSRGQYLSDVDRWGYRDARLAPIGNMTSEDIAWWTSFIERDK
ncbi:MAG: nucleotidyltransferase [Polyangiaceae bacterium]